MQTAALSRCRPQFQGHKRNGSYLASLVMTTVVGRACLRLDRQDRCCRPGRLWRACVSARLSSVSAVSFERGAIVGSFMWFACFVTVCKTGVTVMVTGMVTALSTALRPCEHVQNNDWLPMSPCFEHFSSLEVNGTTW